VRNVRRLQLVFLNLFYERIQLYMHHSDSVPTSKPVVHVELNALVKQIQKN